jgi:DNA (cytosine-5)-methyltransferase 1
LPMKTHSNYPDPTGSLQLKPWTTFWEATCDLQGREMQGTNLTPLSSKYLKFVPPGGNWIHLPENIKKKAMGGAFDSGGGKMGYFRRLTWDAPTPTVTTHPAQKSTMLCHPEELRPMSVDEYKRVQGFPDDWDLPESNPIKYELIGNAVPVYLSYAIASHVSNLLEG